MFVRFVCIIVACQLLSTAMARPVVSEATVPSESLIPHHRTKRQISDVVLQISHLLGFLVTIVSQSTQQIGRFGQDLVGENSGGLLAFLESAFVGVEVSGDFIRNFLNSLVKLFDTAVGTPEEEHDEVKQGNKNKIVAAQQTKISRTTNKSAGTSRGQSKQPTAAASNDVSLGRLITSEVKRIQAISQQFLSTIRNDFQGRI